MRKLIQECPKSVENVQKYAKNCEVTLKTLLMVKICRKVD